MAPALLCWKKPFKGAAGRDEHIISVFFFFFHCCSISVSFSDSEMWQRAQIGKSEWKSWQVVPLCFPPPHTHSLTLSPPPSPRLSLSLARCCYRPEREVTFKMKSRSVRKNVKAFMLSHGININSLSLSAVPPPFVSSLFAYSPLLYPFPSSIVCVCVSLSLCLLMDSPVSVCLRLCARVLTREGVRPSVYSLMRLCVRAAMPAGRLR